MDDITFIILYFVIGLFVCGIIVIPLSNKIHKDPNQIIKEYLEGKF